MFKRLVLICLVFILVMGCSSREANSNETKVPHSELEYKNGVFYRHNEEEPFNGKTIQHHDNGQVYAIGNFKNGKLHGKATIYYDNGQVNLRENYKDGELHGIKITYYENGQIEWKKTYKKGEQYGEVIRYHENGRLISIGEMVLVSTGTTSSDNGSVVVENDFYIGKYHVTQAEFEEVMGFNPSRFRDTPHNPVEKISWYDAVMYCNKLSEANGLEKYYNIRNIDYNPIEENSIHSAEVTENEGANGYRLPTEAEHEYAMRGGKDGNVTTYAGSDDLDEVGWYMENSNSTMPVGQKKPNELEIYDMSGNVYDWTNSLSDSDRILRGGSWYYFASFCKFNSWREYPPSINHVSYLGFRLARTP